MQRPDERNTHTGGHAYSHCLSHEGVRHRSGAANAPAGFTWEDPHAQHQHSSGKQKGTALPHVKVDCIDVPGSPYHIASSRAVSSAWSPFGGFHSPSHDVPYTKQVQSLLRNWKNGVLLFILVACATAGMLVFSATRPHHNAMDTRVQMALSSVSASMVTLQPSVPTTFYMSTTGSEPVDLWSVLSGTHPALSQAPEPQHYHPLRQHHPEHLFTLQHAPSPFHSHASSDPHSAYYDTPHSFHHAHHNHTHTQFHIPHTMDSTEALHHSAGHHMHTRGLIPPYGGVIDTIWMVSNFAWMLIDSFGSGLSADAQGALLAAVREGALYVMRANLNRADPHNPVFAVAQWDGQKEHTNLKVWLLTRDAVGADLLAGASGALAAASMAVKATDPDLAHLATAHALYLHSFASSSEQPQSHCSFVPCLASSLQASVFTAQQPQQDHQLQSGSGSGSHSQSHAHDVHVASSLEVKVGLGKGMQQGSGSEQMSEEGRVNEHQDRAAGTVRADTAASDVEAHKSMAAELTADTEEAGASDRVVQLPQDEVHAGEQPVSGDSTLSVSTEELVRMQQAGSSRGYSVVGAQDPPQQQLHDNDCLGGSLALGAVWLYRATGNTRYLDQAEAHMEQLYKAHENAGRCALYTKDSQAPAAALLLSKVSGSSSKTHHAHLKAVFASLKQTQHPLGTAFLALAYADTFPSAPRSQPAFYSQLCSSFGLLARISSAAERRVDDPVALTGALAAALNPSLAMDHRTCQEDQEDALEESGLL